MILLMKQSIKMHTDIFGCFNTMCLTIKEESRSVVTRHIAEIHWHVLAD